MEIVGDQDQPEDDDDRHAGVAQRLRIVRQKRQNAVHLRDVVGRKQERDRHPETEGQHDTGTDRGAADRAHVDHQGRDDRTAEARRAAQRIAHRGERGAHRVAQRQRVHGAPVGDPAGEIPRAAKTHPQPEQNHHGARNHRYQPAVLRERELRLMAHRADERPGERVQRHEPDHEGERELHDLAPDHGRELGGAARRAPRHGGKPRDDAAEHHHQL